MSERVFERSKAAIEIGDLSKTFAGQRALADVAMTVLPGEIHALLGQNGSGKSTLIKVLAGVYTPDPGSQITVYGDELRPGLPRESRRLGLQFVHQALGIIGQLTAVENVALGFGYRRRGGVFIDWPAQRRKTKRLLQKLSVDFDIDCPVSILRPVDRAAIAIARALDDDESDVRVLVLDEPTAALPPHEVDLLFGLVRQASEAGTSVIYVSHRLERDLRARRPGDDPARRREPGHGADAPARPRRAGPHDRRRDRARVGPGARVEHRARRRRDGAVGVTARAGRGSTTSPSPSAPARCSASPA